MQSDPSRLAAQLRHPSGADAAAVGVAMNRSNQALNRAALDLLDIAPGEALIEIGPGNAAFAGEVLAMPGTRYAGVDVSAAMVAEARALHAQAVRLGRASFQQGDSSRLPFADACFDAALGVNVVYFWDAPARDLAELARVLKPGGRLCLAFGDAAFMHTLPFSAHGFRLYEREQVEALLHQAGFGPARHSLHSEHGVSNDGRVIPKRFHLLLASRG